MPQTFEYQSTGTAADLIAYEKYTDPIKGKRISRSKNDYQEWLVQARDGEIFYVTFQNNFSKKHLVTDSKKTAPTGTKQVGNPLEKKINDLVVLKWDFNTPGVVVQAANNQTPQQWAKKTGCKVSAKKIGLKPPTWEIFHLNSVI
jgi:hypothetical protein